MLMASAAVTVRFKSRKYPSTAISRTEAWAAPKLSILGYKEVPRGTGDAGCYRRIADYAMRYWVKGKWNKAGG